LVDIPVQIPTSIAVCADCILLFQSDLVFVTLRARAAKINASIWKLLAAAETHVVRPARHREWPAEFAVPATKKEVQSLLKVLCHDRFPAISVVV
jgi:hypothetical protein